MPKLTIGSPEAEAIRKLDQQIEGWLARERPCPLCDDPDYWDEDEDELPDCPEPDLDCELCEGIGRVTGAHIEAYVAKNPRERWILPAWYPKK